ncbi:hypothetical protein [Glycomyces xiaoerkulensis]|uniref:hypothetical protein n=1 Tax=Glycomyces xiaoerkulensis TaxID=2038139 RepID=UPI0012FFE1DE|nr:hypothetical protein [Glycomyces xiaoerkulensis]
MDRLALHQSGLAITPAPNLSIGAVVDGRDRPTGPVKVSFNAESGNQGVTIRRLEGDFRIQLEHLILTVDENDESATVTGQSGGAASTLHVPKGRTLTGISIPFDENVDLWLDEDATLRNFSGRCRIDKAAGATIEAAQGESFQYVGVRSGRPDTGDRVRGLTLRGVHIEPGREGRSRLVELTEVRVLEPAINLKTYPDQWRRPFRSIDSLRKRAKNDPDKEKAVDDLLDCTYFYQELDTLIADKCGSGAIRSRTAWNRARAQHLRSRRTERWMYGLFRLVGYGQRPIPPLLAWIGLALAATLAAIGLGADVSPTPGEFATLWLYLLFTPFVVLRLAAETQAPNTDLFIGLDPLQRQLILPMQVLVLAAFLFLLAAIRNYMRSSLPRLLGRRI